jgi:hypothetical protein
MFTAEDQKQYIVEDWCVRTKESYVAPLSPCAGATKKVGTLPSTRPLAHECSACRRPIWQDVAYSVAPLVLA